MAVPVARKTRFTSLVVGPPGAGDPSTKAIGSVMLTQSLGSIQLTDTVATAKCNIPAGSDIDDIIIDVTTAFEASAAVNAEISVSGTTNFFGTIGLSAAGRYRVSERITTQVTAAGFASWLAVAASNSFSSVANITVRVTATTTPSAGAAVARIFYTTGV